MDVPIVHTNINVHCGPLTEILSLTNLKNLHTCRKMEAEKRWKQMFNFMLPAVTLPTQYTVDCIYVLVFLIYEMAGLRNDFGKSISFIPT